MTDKNYVVYFHRDVNGDIRYVGSGRLKRAKETHAKSSRGNKYQEFVESNGKLSVDIIHYNLSKLQSLELEIELFDKYFGFGLLLNKNRPSKGRIQVDADSLNELFYYDETSKSCLRWKITTSNGKGGLGKEVGQLTNQGYYSVKINSMKYPVSRIILMMQCINLDNLVVDHINGNRQDNRFTNLKVCSASENSRNRSKTTNTDKILPNGVSIHKNSAIIARLIDPSIILASGRSKEMYKSFSISKYGLYQAIQLAINARKEMERVLFEKLEIQYTERHGK